jgi:hypothetical protein
MVLQQSASEKRRRINFVLCIAFFICSELMVVFAPQMTYVPTIVNGFISAISILTAIAVFYFSQFLPKIKNKTIRLEYRQLSYRYIFRLFFVLMFGISLGYASILQNQLFIAFSFFNLTFVVICALILDIWVISEKFLLEI